MSIRKHYDSRFKVQVALEAIKDQLTISEISSEYGVHPNQISKWKKKLHFDKLNDHYLGMCLLNIIRI